MSGLSSFALWLISLLWFYKLFEYVFDVRRLWILHDFYHYLLEIPDHDIQTVSWQIVVARLMALRDANPRTAQNISAANRRFLGHQSKQRMDAHDIANRIMRKDNYLIALFNKDILDLTIPIPFLRNRQFFSEAMEWNINLCVMDYVFNKQGQVKYVFLKEQYRRGLVENLQLRFKIAAVMSILTAPLVVITLFTLYFLRYFMVSGCIRTLNQCMPLNLFQEFKMNPSQVSSRGFTPFAEWKFREFNELLHLFQRRTNMAYPYATRYLEQFPKDKTFQVYRFVAFIAGALAAVLFVVTLFDTEDFLGFEITPNKTAIFYIGVLGTIHVAARGALPEENLVLDPEFALQNVIECTHYCPASWRGQLHSDEVRKEFSELYQLKAVTFCEEILSLLFTPLILWFSLPKRSARIVDFFREFTVHVDGLGHVCSFAVFDFKRGVENIAQNKGQKTGVDGLREDYYSTKDGKLLASYYGFLDNYATNPQKGGVYSRTTSRRQFYPPPSFPGLMSPQMTAELGFSGGRPQSSRQQIQQTTKFGQAAASSSPIHSILLDPHNQPSVSALRNSPNLSTQSRYRPNRYPLTRNDESREDDAGRSAINRAADFSRIVEEDNNLGESWRTTLAAQLDGEGNDVDSERIDKGAGVLGLLYQFQKAQTEGKTTGVGI
jgi:autophagy-related protein 9